MKRWVKNATDSTEAEARLMALKLGDEVLRGVRHDTASSDEEANALMRRLRHLEHSSASRRSLLPMLFGGGALLATAAAAAAAAIVVAPQLLQVNTANPSNMSELALHIGDDVALTPSIRIAGEGHVQVLDVHDLGAEVSLTDGMAKFHVTPNGPASQLLVHADDVEVVVQGTVFTVQRLDDQVSVQVERGSVQVSQHDWTAVLEQGDSWRTGDHTTAGTHSVPASLGVIAKGPIEQETIVATAPAAPIKPSAVVAPAAPAEPTALPINPTQDSTAVTDPCQIDSWSQECARTKLRDRQIKSPEIFHAELQRAIMLVEQDLQVARQQVEACNQFLDQHGDTSYAPDVRGYRVRAAFSASRSTEVVNYADDYLANTPTQHAAHADVVRWRQVTVLRKTAANATRNIGCEAALPTWRQLAAQEVGQRKTIARGWLGVCAAEQGYKDEAIAALQGLRQEKISDAELLQRIQKAWQIVRP
jgi:hypothetical protein